MGISNELMDEDANNAVQRALRKIRCWHTPENWSGRDWWDEVEAITATAGWRAEMDYDPGQRVPRSAFIYRRAITSAWTRYRQEWAYCRHFARETANPIELMTTTSETGTCGGPLNCNLGEALSQLTQREQWLIRQLFWHGATEGRLATKLRISQQAVSRRKGRALKHLRRLLHHPQQSLLRLKVFLTSAFLAQSLDLITLTDCGL